MLINKRRRKIMTFDELIQLAREQSSEVQRDKGTLFEKIAQIYFKNEPTYKTYFQMFGY